MIETATGVVPKEPHPTSLMINATFGLILRDEERQEKIELMSVGPETGGNAAKLIVVAVIFPRKFIDATIYLINQQNLPITEFLDSTESIESDQVF